MRSLSFIFKEFLQSIAQNRFLHFTYGVQVTISLLVLGVFFVLLIGAAFWWAKLGQALEIHVFLKDGLSPMQHVEMENAIKELPNVQSVTFRSKEDAIRLFAEQYKSISLDDLLEDNPLPASLVVTTRRPEHIAAVVEKIKELDGILNIRYGQDVLVKYQQVMLIIIGISIVTVGLLMVFTYSSISNIIGLSVYARRTEIRIMQLVGATWWFIRWPFVFEGVFFGALGAVIAFLIIYLVLLAMTQAMRMASLSQAVPGLGVTDMHIFAGLVILLVGLGVLIGFFSSLRSVNTFLRRDTEIQIGAAKVRQLLR